MTRRTSYGGRVDRRSTVSVMPHSRRWPLMRRPARVHVSGHARGWPVTGTTRIQMRTTAVQRQPAAKAQTQDYTKVGTTLAGDPIVWKMTSRSEWTLKKGTDNDTIGVLRAKHWTRGDFRRVYLTYETEHVVGKSYRKKTTDVGYYSLSKIEEDSLNFYQFPSPVAKIILAQRDTIVREYI